MRTVECLRFPGFLCHKKKNQPSNSTASVYSGVFWFFFFLLGFFLNSASSDFLLTGELSGCAGRLTISAWDRGGVKGSCVFSNFFFNLSHEINPTLLFLHVFLPCWHKTKCPLVIHHVWIDSDPYLAGAKMTIKMKSVTYMLWNERCSLSSQYSPPVWQTFWGFASNLWTVRSETRHMLHSRDELVQHERLSFKIRAHTNLSVLFVFFNLLGGWHERGHSVKLPLLFFMLIISTLMSRR